MPGTALGRGRRWPPRCGRPRSAGPRARRRGRWPRRGRARRPPPPAAGWPGSAASGTGPRRPAIRGPSSPPALAMTASRPSNHIGKGGIVVRTSSASSSATAARSARSTASMYRRSTARSSRGGLRRRRPVQRGARAGASSASPGPAAAHCSRTGRCLPAGPRSGWPASRARRAGSAPPAAVVAGAGSRPGTPARSSPWRPPRRPARRRAARRVRQPAIDQPVGERLQPRRCRYGERSPTLGSDGGARCCGSTRRARPSRASRHAFVAIRYSQARIVERPSKAREVPPGAQERLLHEVLGLVEGAEHPVAVHPKLPLMALDEGRERHLVTRPRSGHHLVVPGTHRRPPPTRRRATPDPP